jgi:hypothetical protein
MAINSDRMATESRIKMTLIFYASNAIILEFRFCDRQTQWCVCVVLWWFCVCCAIASNLLVFPVQAATQENPAEQVEDVSESESSEDGGIQTFRQPNNASRLIIYCLSIGLV